MWYVPRKIKYLKWVYKNPRTTNFLLQRTLYTAFLYTDYNIEFWYSDTPTPRLHCVTEDQMNRTRGSRIQSSTRVSEEKIMEHPEILQIIYRYIQSVIILCDFYIVWDHDADVTPAREPDRSRRKTNASMMRMFSAICPYVTMNTNCQHHCVLQETTSYIHIEISTDPSLSHLYTYLLNSQCPYLLVVSTQ